MAEYRCCKADRIGGIYANSRSFVEDGLYDARKRAMKMIHGDRGDSVLIYLESDYKKRPWVGYTEKVVLSSKNDYVTYNKKGTYELNKDGSVKRK